MERVSCSWLDMKLGLVFAPQTKGGGGHRPEREEAGGDNAEPPERRSHDARVPPQRIRCTAGFDESPRPHGQFQITGAKSLVVRTDHRALIAPMAIIRSRLARLFDP